MGSQKDLKKLLQELQITATRHYKDNLISLVVFGSVAKGKATPESDIDLLVILKEKDKGSYKTYMDFYENVIPEELYTEEDALKAIKIAEGYLQVAQSV